jgi:hypothetical protein
MIVTLDYRTGGKKTSKGRSLWRQKRAPAVKKSVG